MITWQVHRRTREMCRALDIPVYELLSVRSAPIRYLSLAYRTIRTIIHHSPERIIVQNPSLVLTLLSLLIRPLFSFRLIVDAHNEAVTPVVHDSALVRAISKWVLRKSDLTIVTNRSLAAEVEQIGGVPAILPDAIPAPQSKAEKGNGLERTTIAIISTAAPDEPLDVVIDAAKRLPEMDFRVTGNQAKFESRYGSGLPANMTSTGFLPDDEYWLLLSQATMIVDLTTMPDCLVCGAYEAIAVGTPLILSRNDATEEVFGPCSILVANEGRSVEAAIRDIAKDPDVHRRIVADFRLQYEKEWQASASQLLRNIEAL